MAFVKVSQVSAVPEGGMIYVQAHGKDILLAKVGGEIFAMDQVCMHEGGPLHEGTLDGHTVICPWHEGRYDVRNGKADPETDWVTDTASWRVKVEGDDVLVDLD